RRGPSRMARPDPGRTAGELLSPGWAVHRWLDRRQPGPALPTAGGVVDTAGSGVRLRRYAVGDDSALCSRRVFLATQVMAGQFQLLYRRWRTGGGCSGRRHDRGWHAALSNEAAPAHTHQPRAAHFPAD